MQGRLSPIIRNRIQAFPFNNWRKEFLISKKIDLNLMEWTIDLYNLKNNPIMKKNGMTEIKKLKKKYGLKIESITCDFLMETPFFKRKTNKFYEDQFYYFLENCSKLGIRIIVIPLVDNGSIKNIKEEKNVINFFKNLENYLKSKKLLVAFESDYNPKKLKKFINNFSSNLFGINYDMGNSAGLNYDYKKEINLYFDKIYNVHIKDKNRSNVTVPLFSGKTEILEIIKLLLKRGYKGNFILQAARSQYEHVHMIKNYSEILKNYVKKN